METKFCPRCKQTLSADQFRKSKTGKLKFCCNACLKEYKRQKYQENREAILQKGKEYIQRNKEKVKVYQDRYRQEHREVLNQQAKEYRDDKKKEIQIKDRARNKNLGCKEWRKAYIKQRLENDSEFRERTYEQQKRAAENYYLKHKEEILSSKHQNYILNRDMIRKKRQDRLANDETFRNIIRNYGRNYRARHPEANRIRRIKRRAAEKLAPSNITKEWISAQYEIQAHKCFYCDVDLNNKFHIDHIKPISKFADGLVSNLCLSCAWCNISKGAKILYLEWVPPNVKKRLMIV